MDGNNSQFWPVASDRNETRFVVAKHQWNIALMVLQTVKYLSQAIYYEVPCEEAISQDVSISLLTPLVKRLSVPRDDCRLTRDKTAWGVENWLQASVIGSLVRLLCLDPRQMEGVDKFTEGRFFVQPIVSVHTCPDGKEQQIPLITEYDRM